MTKYTKAYNPVIYERTSEGDFTYDIYSRLLKDRIIFLGEDLDSEVANCLVSQMLWLDKQSNDPISLYINCNGGDISGLFAIYDIMQFIDSPINTFVLGIAASAAAVLLCAGDKGSRYALPNSEIMIHQPLSGCQGQVTEISIYNKQLIKSKKKMISIIARHCGKPYEEVERDCERDFWLSPEEAIKYGLIDKITEKCKGKELPPLKHIKYFKKNNNNRNNNKKAS